MAGRLATTVAIAAIAAVLCCSFLTVSFVAAPGAASGGNLRATRSFAAQPLPAPASGSSTSALAACSAAALLLAAGAAVARRGVARAAGEVEFIPRPEDLLESPKFPLYIGTTSGYFSRSTRERHAITWTAKDEAYFEMPTSGYALMNKGENLCYFRRKEQCIALGKKLRKLKIDNYKIYRIKKDGTVIFMHPADGVFPEKVSKGRVQVNGRPFSAGGNPQPVSVKWSKYHNKPYEADPLTTMFVKARLVAFTDEQNLFPLPNPTVYGNVTEEQQDRIKAYEEKTWEAFKDMPEPPDPPKSL